MFAMSTSSTPEFNPDDLNPADDLPVEISTNGHHSLDGLMATVVETTDEDGNVHYFEKVEEIELDGQQYALLIYQGEEDAEEPEDEDEGFDEEYVLMKISVDEDGEQVYEAIEDEDEFKKVMAEMEKLDYEFDVTGCDDEDCDDPAHGHEEGKPLPHVETDN